MFIVVTGKEYRLSGVPAYLYSGQTVISEPVENFFGSYMVIVDTGTDDTYRSEYVCDRLSSGLFGAKLFETLEEAEEYIESEKAL